MSIILNKKPSVNTLRKERDRKQRNLRNVAPPLSELVESHKENLFVSRTRTVLAILPKAAKKQARYCVPAFCVAPVKLVPTTHGLTDT